MSLCDLVSSKIIVMPTIIFTIKRGESHILRITNKPKLFVLSHVIPVYTRNSVLGSHDGDRVKRLVSR